MPDLPSLAPPTVDDPVPVNDPTDPVSKAAGIAPLTSSVMQKPPMGFMQELPRLKSYRQMYQQGDVPLDTETGISAWDRLQLGARNAREDQLRYLRTKYGADKVDYRGGRWVVRVNDPQTGKPKDILADPVGMDLGDFAAIAGDVPEMAGWLLGEAGAAKIPSLSKVKGVARIARNVVSGTLGAESAGAVKDSAIREHEGSPIDLPEIGRRRTAQAGVDVTLGVPLGVGAEVFQWLKAPFNGSRSKVQFDAITAQRRLMEEKGEIIPLTVGQSTGNPDIIRREKFTGKVLGGSRTYQQFTQDQQASMNKLQNIMLGSEPADDEVLGQQIISALSRKVDPVTGAVESAKAEVQFTVKSQLEKLIGEKTLPERQLANTYVGDIIRARMFGLRDEAKAKATAAYTDFEKAGGKGALFQADDLANAAKKIEQSLPPQFTSKGAEASTAFVPEQSILKRLKELQASQGHAYRFSDLQKMRSEVMDDLSKSEAVPGLGSRYLTQISGAITEAMEKGVESLGSPELKALLQNANKIYREEVVPFGKKGVSEMFANEFESRWIGSSELASKFKSGPGATDRYNLLKQFLGSDSLEFKALKRSILDDVLSEAHEPGGELLNAKRLFKSLSEFSQSSSTKEVATDILGDNLKNAIEEAKLLLKAEATDKIPASEIDKWLASKSPSTDAVLKLVHAERLKDKSFQTPILKALADHSTENLKLAPEDIVNRLFSGERKTQQIREVMGLLSDRPALIEDIRTSYLAKIFHEGGIEGKSITDALKESSLDKKARTILGDKLFEDLKQFGAIESAINVHQGVAEMAGSMAAGGRIDRLLTHPLKTSSTAIREWVTAKVLTSDLIRKWAMKTDSSDPGALYLLFSNAPFMESLSRNFGPGTASQNAAHSIKSSIEDWMKSSAPSQQQSPTQTLQPPTVQ